VSNKAKRSELRRSGKAVPERMRQVGRRRVTQPGRNLFDALVRRLHNNECPQCGAKIQTRVDMFSKGALIGRPKTKAMPICLNGHRQDVWEPQRPQAKVEKGAKTK
jgi:hypothetical protein